MIDIHHHCLHGVDDGPRTLDEAVQLVRMAADEGIETIVATPHVLRGRWPVHSPLELESRMRELRDAVGDTPRLILGSEYYFGHDMTELLRAGESIVPLAGGRYVLLELASNSVPPMLEQPLYRAQLEGWMPVIAHPERNTVFQAKPELLHHLINHGALVQVTATSLTGAFGAQARAAAETFIRRNLVHFIASDAHNIDKRPPRVREAIDVLRSLAGDEITHALTHANPLSVVENRGLAWVPEPQESRPSGFFTRLRSFLAPRQPYNLP